MYMQILYQCIYNGFNLRPPNCQKIGKLQLPRWGLLKNALLQYHKNKFRKLRFLRCPG